MKENIDLTHELDDVLIMAAKTNENEQVGSKYPYYPLSAALKIAEAIKDLGGARTSVKKSLLAKQLGAVENSAAFAQQLASARTYGAIEGRGDSALTETSKRYFFPTTETDKSLALLEMFATPTAFSELLKRFDGDRLPTREILGNILHRDLGIPDSWKDRVAALFSNSAQSVGVIDGNGFLRYDANRHHPESNTVSSSQPAAVVESTAPREVATARVIRTGGNIWNYTLNGKAIQVQTPEELDPQLWRILHGYIQLLKPHGEP